jgi:hypothetical protein
MTPATLRFLRSLTDRITLQTSDPDWWQSAQQIAAAQDELDKEIAGCPELLPTTN